MAVIKLKYTFLGFLIFITSCTTGLTENIKSPTKKESVTKESIVVHIGLPKWMGGKGQLYIDPSEAQQQISAEPMSPMEYLIYKMGMWFTWIAGLSALGIIIGVVCMYLNRTYLQKAIPFGKDIMIISSIFLLGSLGIIFFLNYIYWIAGIVALCVSCYLIWAGYRMYKTYHDKNKTEKVVETKEKVIEELVKTGEVLKKTTSWGEAEKNKIMNIQSDETIQHVKNIREKLDLVKNHDKI